MKAILLLLMGSLLTQPLTAAEAVDPITAMANKAKATACVQNAKTIAVAVHLYAVEHGGSFPKELSEIKAGALPQWDRVSICPLDPDKKPGGYELLLPGRSMSSIENPAQTVLFRAKFADAEGFRTTAYVDGHIERVKDEAKDAQAK